MRKAQAICQQPENVKKAIAPFVPKTNKSGQEWPEAWDITGGDLILRKSGNGLASYLADDLAKLGVPGIRYLDGGSRGTGQGTSNYVVFPGNESMLSILSRNGQQPGTK